MHFVLTYWKAYMNPFIIIIIILFKSGNMAHKHKQETLFCSLSR